MILIIDPGANRVVDANPMACRTLGYTRREFQTLKTSDLHPEVTERFRDFVDSVLDEGNGWTDEFECLTRWGDRVPVEIAASRIDLGGTPCVLAIVRNLADRQRAERRMRALSQRIVTAQEAERRRVARELHDGVGQLLSSALFRARSLIDSLRADDGEARAHAERMNAVLERAMSEVRTISQNLMPSELEDLGLVPAVRMMCEEFSERTGIPVTVGTNVDGDRFHGEIELTLYRAIQEALTNIDKHAAASRVGVAVRDDGAAIVARIRDDGIGLSARREQGNGSRGSGIGLASMMQRASYLGGTVQVEPVPGSGTEIVVRVPRSPLPVRNDVSRD